MDRHAAAVEAEHRRIRAVLGPRGVPLRSFFQPDAFAAPRQLDGVRRLYRVLPGLLERDELAQVLDGVTSGLSPEVVDLRHLYDAEPDPLLLDVVHTNERGAELVADAMYPALRPTIRERAR